MTATTTAQSMALRLTQARTGTGGPSDEERRKLIEQIAGWTLTVLVAVLATRLGLM
ncbi:SCO1431 family membrane protein [Streptomyces daliensis]|uniref:SCO1431 family membrane protein n=1 Tax=Streptomyces daliensis TaxID=299421 RepID=A0A8T4IY23_9ACTN|nr:SCO1431 family membrane protein [Streptomyces daliensis]